MASRRVRIALKILLACVVLVVLLVGGVFVALQTGPVKRAIASFAAKAAGDEMHLTVDGLSGVLPFSIRLERVAIAESEEADPWLVARNLYLSWSPLDLVSGNLHVDTLSAEDVTLRELPPPPKKPKPEKPSGPVWPPPSLSLPNVQVDTISVERFSMGRAVVGQAADYGVHGNARVGGGQADVDLSVTRLDGPESAIKALIATRGVDTGAPELDVDIEVHEPPNGLLAAATGIEQKAPLSLTLTGKGPLSAWNGTLAANHGQEQLADLGLSLAVAEDSLGFGVDGGVATGPLVGAPGTPGLLEPMLSEEERGAVRELGERVTLAVDGRCLLDSGGDVQGLELARADVSARSLNLNATGRIGSSLDDMDMKANAHVEDLAFLNAFMDKPLRGSLALSADVSSDKGSLRGDVNLTMQDAGFQEYGAGKTAITLHITPLEEAKRWDLNDPKKPLPPVHAQLALDVSGLALPAGMDSVTQAVGDSPRLTGEFETVDGNAVRIESLDLAAATAKLAVSGQASLDGPTKTQVTLTADDLAAVADAFDMKDAGLAGGATVTIDVDGNWSAPSGTVVVDAKTRQLVVDANNATAPQGSLAAILGSEPTASVKADLSESGALDVSRFTVTARAISLQGSAQANINDPKAPLKVEVDAKADSLEPFSALAGTKLGGALTLSVRGSGDMDAPNLSLDLAIDQPRVDQQAFEKLAVKVDGSGPLDAWTGAASVNLAAVVEGQPAALDVRTDFTRGAERLAFDNLAIKGPGIALNGDLALLTDSGLVTGSLAGGAEDLGRLGAFAKVDLGGSLQTSIALKDVSGAQAVDLTTTLRNVQAPGAAVGSADIEAHLTDVTAAPQGTARVKVQDISASGFAAKSFSLTADGGGTGMDIGLKLDGQIEAGAEPAPVDLSLKGRLEQPDGGVLFRLTGLSGSLDERPLSLPQPGSVSFTGGKLAIEPLTLGWGDARISAKGGWGAERADLTVGIADLTADSVMQLIGNQAVGPEATLTLQLEVTGPLSKPAADVTVSAKGMRLRVAEDSPLTAMQELSVDAEAHVTGGKLTAKAEVGGLPDGQARLEAELPATFSLEPFAFEVPMDGALSANVQADAQLKGFEPILAFFGVTASGAFTADFTIDGTPSNPGVGGKAAIKNGRIEYVDTGSVVSNLDLEFVAADSPASDAPRLIVNLTAEDGEKGSVQVSGWVDVDPAKATPFMINVALAKFTAVRMDMLRMAATGNVALEGDMQKSRIVGGITLAPVQVWLPEQLPPSVAEVEVVDVRTMEQAGPEGAAKNATKEAEASKPAAQAAFDPSLELGVEVKEGMRVQGLGVDTTWKGRLDVSGHLSGPKLTGNVSTTQGSLEFLGKKFDIRKGTLNFWGQNPPSPRVEVEATTQAGDVLAIIRVYGQADSPQFSLASEPSRPRDEILSYILFGRELNSISPVQALKIAQTATMIAAGSDFMSIQRNASKLPFLSGVDIGLTDTDKGSAVELGTDVSEGVHVNVEQGVGNSATQVEVEVDLTKNFSVRGTVDDQGDQGVGVDWRLDY